MAHVLFGPEVREMLQEDNRQEMKAFCENLHPATVAEALADEFAVAEVWRFLENTSIRNQAAVFEYFPLEWQVKMVEGAGRERMAHLIEKMSHDDRVDLLRRLMPRVAEGLLRLVDDADRKDIATLVSQKENTAGALMTTEYAWIPPHISATEALRLIRLQAPDRETIYYVFVLDDQHKLLGVVSLRDLIMAPPQSLIRDVMEDQVVSVKTGDDREIVAKEIAHYDLLAIPVVDEHGRMVGIITHDDVIDVVVQEATEDVHRMGAVSPLEENYLEANFVTIWRNRAFWLACLFIGGMFTIFALARFQEALAELLILSLFIPLCISTGGNSGSQAATLITRALALGQLSGSDWFRVFRHELVMGIALGLTLGALGFICGVVTHAFHQIAGQNVNAWMLGFVIFQAVVGICLWGTLVGSMLPLVLRRIGIDPAVASSPFVATLVDVTGILIYFSIASIYLL